MKYPTFLLSLRPLIGVSGKRLSDELTTTVTFTLLMPSLTMVVSSEVAVILLSNALMSRMRERSALADVPRLMLLNTSLSPVCFPLNNSSILTTTVLESGATASIFKLAISGLI